MAESPKFKIWVNQVLFHAGKSPEERVEEEMQPGKLLVEVRDGNEWKSLS